MNDDWKPDIFTYLDYREYLRDYYAAAKGAVSAFSYRYFSRKAGFTSPNYLKLVAEGQRNLTDDSIRKMVAGLALGPDEARFFEALVEFDQAGDAEKKNAAFERVSASQRFRQARRIDRGMFEYLSRWYYPAIREMAARADFRDDPRWIAENIFPRIRPREAQRALNLLFDMGLLERRDDGSIERVDPTLTTGHEVRSLAVGNYHRQMLERAASSIESVPREMRDLSSLVVCIGQDTVADLKSRIHAFRESLIELSERDEEKRGVYQIGIQMFPLSKWDES